MLSRLQTYGIGNAVSAFDRQLLLADLAGDLDWAYDVQAGLLSFGDRFQWHADILGTESEETDTWLWAWANKASNIPAKQQQASLKLKALGEQHGVAELSQSMVPLEYADAHFFGCIALVQGLGNAYYRAPYEGGAALLLIVDNRLVLQVNDQLTRILTVFPRAISALELHDHRHALRGYLESYGFDPEQDGAALVLRQHGQEILRAEFDDLGRLREFHATLTE